MSAKHAAAALLLLGTPFLVATTAVAADCSVVIDDITKAISGNLNMSAEKKASMLRMAVSSYDHCMVGDAKSADNIRSVIMQQVRENLGGK